MSAIDYQHNYYASNIDDPESEGSYVVQVISMSYAIQNSMELNVDTMAEVTLLCDPKHISPEQ